MRSISQTFSRWSGRSSPGSLTETALTRGIALQGKPRFPSPAVQAEDGNVSTTGEDVNESRGETFLSLTPLKAFEACGEVRQSGVTIIGIYGIMDMVGPVRVRNEENDGSH